MPIVETNICPAILTSLSDNLINNALNVNIHGGALQALTDPTNMIPGQVIRLANDNGTGQAKQVRVVYKQRMLASDAQTTKECEVGGDELTYLEDTFEVNEYRGMNFSMSEAQIRVYCESYLELVRITNSNVPGTIVQIANGLGSAQTELSVIREMFTDFQASSNALVQAINAKLLDMMDTGKGSWVGGDTNKYFDVEGANGEINALGLFQMKQEYMKTGFRGAPIIIGGAGALQRVWMNDSRYFGQGANGINFAQVRDNTGIAQFYYDENSASQLGNEERALIFAPGSAIYTPYLQYVGQYGKIGTMNRFTMPLPGMPSVKADCRILEDACSESYTIYLEQFFDLYTPPTDLFADGDKNEGVNGIFQATFTEAPTP
jgi:hypothetical protein